MTFEDHTKILQWKKEHKLTKSTASVLMECWRRINMFQKGNAKANLLLLATHTITKESKAKNLVTPSYREVPRSWNWYKLTDRGIKIINDIPLQWKEEYNLYIFEHTF